MISFYIGHDVGNCHRLAGHLIRLRSEATVLNAMCILMLSVLIIDVYNNNTKI